MALTIRCPSATRSLTPEQQIDFATAMKPETNFDCARTRVALSLLGLTVLKKRPIYRHKGEWKKFEPESVPEDAVRYFYVVHGKTRGICYRRLIFYLYWRR